MASRSDVVVVLNGLGSQGHSGNILCRSFDGEDEDAEYKQTSEEREGLLRRERPTCQPVDSHRSISTEAGRP